MARSDTIKPRRPAASVNPVPIWPTPEKTNLVFWVEKNGTLPENKGWALKDSYSDRVTYPDHKLVYVSPEDVDGWSRWYYASDRVYEDNYNWEFTQANIGGQTFDAVQRTYLIPREDFTEATPAAGAAMPRDPEVGDPAAYMFPTGYVLAGRRQQRTGDDMFDGVYVVEVRDYVKKVTITSLGVDELNGKVRTSTDTLYYATEIVTGALTAAALFAAPTNAYWGLQSDGTQRSGRQLTADWYLINTEVVVAGTYVGGVVSVNDYFTSENDYWPPVLADFEFMDWVRNDGGTDIYPRYEFAPDGYNGPVKVRVEVSWSQAVQTLTTINPMLPTPITYASPYFRLAIPSCLHVAVDAVCDIGSGDPIYALNSGSTRTIPTTNYTVWPANIVKVDQQTPFRGGYLRTKKTYYKPPDTFVA